VKIPKKAALICALVMMVSLVPAFALNETDNTTTTDQSQAQNGTGNQNQHKCQGSCDSAGENCGSCDGDQHKYQYGQKNCESGSANCDQGHQYGQGNGNASAENCDGTNCKKTV
jgi:hypothetical protein